MSKLLVSSVALALAAMPFSEAIDASRASIARDSLSFAAENNPPMRPLAQFAAENNPPMRPLAQVAVVYDEQSHLRQV